MDGFVFDMQHYSLHDGPGIRTLVFLKGCPLCCQWCSNPESQSLENEVMVSKQECIGMDKCGLCLKACKAGAISISRNNDVEINRTLCNNCGDCAEACPGNALRNTNKKISISNVLKYVLQDLPFYKKSGGGVTLSGGEPLLQYDFCLELLKELKRNRIHTAIETTAFCEWNKLKEISDYIDLFLIDIKHMDDNIHKELTGVSNRLILENIHRLSELGKQIEIRIPLIPGINDSEENLTQTAKFVSDKVKGAKVTLLLYHRLGSMKYEQLGKPSVLGGLSPIKTQEDINYLKDRKKIFEKFSIVVHQQFFE